MTEKSFLIDSNILIYSLDNSDERKHQISLEILEDCFGREEIFAVSAQNLAELSVVIKSKIKDKDDLKNVKSIIKDIIKFRNFKKINYNGRTVLKALDFIEENDTDFWNALIAATMIENGIFNIYTENIKDFRKIHGIKAINPFR